MSEPTLADRLRGIVAWIRDGGEGCVRQPDPDELEGIADEVRVLVDQNNLELRLENNRLRNALLASYQERDDDEARHGDLFVRAGQRYRKLRKENTKLKGVLRSGRRSRPRSP